MGGGAACRFFHDGIIISRNYISRQHQPTTSSREADKTKRSQKPDARKLFPDRDICWRVLFNDDRRRGGDVIGLINIQNARLEISRAARDGKVFGSTRNSISCSVLGFSTRTSDSIVAQSRIARHHFPGVRVQ